MINFFFARFRLSDDPEESIDKIFLIAAEELKVKSVMAARQIVMGILCNTIDGENNLLQVFNVSSKEILVFLKLSDANGERSKVKNFMKKMLKT